MGRAAVAVCEGGQADTRLHPAVLATSAASGATGPHADDSPSQPTHPQTTPPLQRTRPQLLKFSHHVLGAPRRRRQLLRILLHLCLALLGGGRQGDG